MRSSSVSEGNNTHRSLRKLIWKAFKGLKPTEEKLAKIYQNERLKQSSQCWASEVAQRPKSFVATPGSLCAIPENLHGVKKKTGSHKLSFDFHICVYVEVHVHTHTHTHTILI